MQLSDDLFFQRCFDLARLGGKSVRPNPNVGCIIVYKGRIIGEGYHQEYGKAHAEVNAINSISGADRDLISKSTAYISLEPCHHFGKTPPCVDLLIKNNIATVKIALADPTEKVNQLSIVKMKKIGIEVSLMSDHIEAKQVISEFYTVHILKRPFVQIKIAKSKHNYIGTQNEQIQLTNQYTNIFTHKLRAYTDAIIVGSNTARIDNPSLTLRNYPGQQPLRLVLDRKGTLPETHKLFSDNLPTIIVTENEKLKIANRKTILLLDFESKDFVSNLLNKLYQKGIYHIMVEGGASLIKSFLDSGTWNEAIVISTNNSLDHGVKAPNINGRLTREIKVDSDIVRFIKNDHALIDY